jgi:uncharacterized protein
MTEKLAVEIKRSSTPTVSKGFYTACDDIKADKRYVVYAGNESFSLGKGIIAISLAKLM